MSLELLQRSLELLRLSFRELRPSARVLAMIRIWGFPKIGGPTYSLHCTWKTKVPKIIGYRAKASAFAKVAAKTCSRDTRQTKTVTVTIIGPKR